MLKLSWEEDKVPLVTQLHGRHKFIEVTLTLHLLFSLFMFNKLSSLLFFFFFSYFSFSLSPICVFSMAIFQTVLFSHCPIVLNTVANKLTRIKGTNFKFNFWIIFFPFLKLKGPCQKAHPQYLKHFINLKILFFYQ